MIKRYEKRVEMNDVNAIFNLGDIFLRGERGLPHNHAKALELFHRAAELGYAGAYTKLGNAYEFGRGVERDEKKAAHYWELGALGGDSFARHNLGSIEERAGNTDRALKHFMIAVRDGCPRTLEAIKDMYQYGLVTKDDYTKALLSYQAYLGEIKSDQRDEVAAFSDRVRELGYNY